MQIDTPPVLASRLQQVAAVAVGNGLEFYDFVTYAFFAVSIGHSFFPGHSPDASLLASLATFGAGFLTRPLGALVIGRMGDRRGRRPAMLLSFLLIGVAVAGLALTPPYSRIGTAAPVLAIGFRMLQGFALGGEVGPSTAFLLEAAPEHRRGLFVSLQAASADLSVLVAGLVGVGLSAAMSPAALDAWGWRLALLLGVAVVPFGLVLRHRLPETRHTAPDGGENVGGMPRARIGRIALIGVTMLGSATIANYTLDFLTTYAITTLRMPTGTAFGATVLVGLTGVVCDPLGGWLSDRFGRKALLVWPNAVLLVLVLPCFVLLSVFRTVPALYATAALLGCAVTLANVSMIVVIAEILPRRVRSGGIALIYAGAIAVFGGSAQLIEAWLTVVTHTPLAPACYMLFAVAVGLVAMLRLDETAPVRRSSAATRG